jgi:catechol 2,3-dioxygenase-like lactoylglutathione lyase family enzyme
VLAGVQHIGVPVRSLERSLAFYRDVLGIEPAFRGQDSGERTSRLVGVPGAVISLAFLRLGNTYLELLEYEHPRGADYDRRNCDVGAVHIAFEVDDLDQVYERLEASGISFSTPPHHIEHGPLAGCATAYFKDPDGIQLEVFEVAPASAVGS